MLFSHNSEESVREGLAGVQPATQQLSEAAHLGRRLTPGRVLRLQRRQYTQSVRQVCVKERHQYPQPDETGALTPTYNLANLAQKLHENGKNWLEDGVRPCAP